MPKGNGIPTAEAIPLLADALAYYDETDVRRWFERNRRMAGQYPTVYPSTIANVQAFREVPNEPFRRAWIAAHQPLIMGLPGDIPTDGISIARFDGIDERHREEPEWCGIFREELQRVLLLPEGFNSRPEKIGPGDLSYKRITDYLHSVLGCKERKSKGKISVAWLMPYEVAEALAKALGLTPIAVGI